jgi:hypothetical protein
MFHIHKYTERIPTIVTLLYPLHLPSSSRYVCNFLTSQRRRQKVPSILYLLIQGDCNFM